ncbi:DNA phosphorothioation system sulfurtransferase DndC [Methylobacterium oryzihabitans]|uniref:DNA phosphorothioation system sulfurtransferase DndC n=1 Tax=Methylobacterium oryzihabitans TaxID=2499852 RepID=A0A437P862_9HYPH|nr:DNA phosphorothioation system sulfurtransferase DndC [Methylobacterium oryzihabitans]RVU18490.1 DNA phosphorothioation system sulfurtransferase DndC [Methylobacterium oryzihabitans]
MLQLDPQSDQDARPSGFKALGFKGTIERRLTEIADLYQADTIPWVVGYSGGKDSTATLQLVWLALSRLPEAARTKPVYVISTDTLVENPVVAVWVRRSLERLGEAAVAARLPIEAHQLKPDLTDTFWVNLIGRGYPAPRPKFRWCTERLKINPSNQFISNLVKANGEAIVVLGTRKAESQARARSMERFEGRRVRERLSPNGKLPNSYVYTPVEDWTSDDVWLFLMQVKNPWGFDNKDLLTMYQGASADGECPLVIDASTPSCGDSRFGCWVCTLVEKDKSMQAMIQNDAEKEWMTPLLNLRNELDVRNDETGKRDDRHLRDFRRMNGSIMLHNDRIVHGPYTQTARERWLRMVLDAQRQARERGPDAMRSLELITIRELREIRRLWVVEKHEIEDNLPRIYTEVTGEAYPDGRLDDTSPFGPEEIQLLRDLCDDDTLHFELTRELLDVERQHRSMARRAGLFKALEQALRRGSYDDANEAEDLALRRRAEFDRSRKDLESVPLLARLEQEGEEPGDPLAGAA